MASDMPRTRARARVVALIFQFAVAVSYSAAIANGEADDHDDHGHGKQHPCQCEAKEQGWTIDCSDQQPMQVRACGTNLPHANAMTTKPAPQSFPAHQCMHTHAEVAKRKTKLLGPTEVEVAEAGVACREPLKSDARRLAPTEVEVAEVAATLLQDTSVTK